MKRIVAIMILAVAAFSACTKDQVEIDPDNSLIGIWVYQGYDNDQLVFTREDEFADNVCYNFIPDGSLIERKNSGWCGTPPISYADYKGSWSVINDTLVRINGSYWGGKMTYNIDIEYVSPTTLRIQTLEVKE
ncbi:MAG: hypothetical protein MUE32_08660 [Bacteroidales bacterium]|jgi:hypothetical protein|nr:hypothetical protein [Bacteroidales bacterium]